MFHTPSTIKTGRLTLRLSNDDRDRDVFLDEIEETDGYIEWTGVIGCDDYYQDRVDNFTFEDPDILYYSIFTSRCPHMVGYVLITLERVPQLGYFVFQDYRRKHICQEATRAVLQRFFNGTLTGRKEKLLKTWIAIKNRASRSLAEKLGFRLTKREPDYDYKYGYANDSMEDVDDPIGYFEEYELSPFEFRLHE